MGYPAPQGLLSSCLEVRVWARKTVSFLCVLILPDGLMYRIALEDPKCPASSPTPATISSSLSVDTSPNCFTRFQTHQPSLLMVFLNLLPILSADSNPIWLPRTPQILPFLQDSHRTGRETTFGATQITPQSCLSTLSVRLHLMSLSRMA